MAMQIPHTPTLMTGGPAPYLVTGDGGMRTPTSFGTYGLGADKGWSANGFLSSARCRELTFNRSYYACSQHDSKSWDANGAFMLPGPPYIRTGLMQSQAPATFVPWGSRRPVAPPRLCRTIVKRYTALIFGAGRFPIIKVPGDSDSQDWLTELCKAERLTQVMTRARNMGGSTGSVGLSWCFDEGRPRVTPHNACRLDVQRWADKDDCIPAHVTQVYRTVRNEWDPEKKAQCDVLYWFRRDWTEEADIVFYPQKCDDKDPIWAVDEESSRIHNDGFCHFVWIQNCPPDDESRYDGTPDYVGNEEQSDALDVLSSVAVMGTLKNLDPTLVLKVQQKLVEAGVIRKGSDNSLSVGEQGQATYLELAGTALTAALSLKADMRKAILESSDCVIPDPDQLTAAGQSAVAIQELYAPMTSQADVYRTQYGDGIERLLKQQRDSYRRTTNVRDPDSGEPAIEVEVDDEGNESEIEHALDLSPRVIEEELDDGSMSITTEPRRLGTSDALDIEWPPYFPMTEDEKQKRAGTLVSANGGKPVVSHQTSVEQFASAVGLDPVEEWRRVRDQVVAEKAGQDAGMFPGMGGEVGDENELPAGAKPSQPLLTRTHAASIVTVNEARGSMGLDHLPDGNEPLDVYKQRKAEEDRAKAADQQQQATTSQDADDKSKAEAQLIAQKAKTEQMLLNKGDIPAILTVDEARAMIGQPPLGGPNGALTVAQWKALQVSAGTEIGKSQAEDYGAAQPEEATPRNPGSGDVGGGPPEGGGGLGGAGAPPV